MQFIDLKRQYALYRDEIAKAVEGVMESGQFILGPKVEELEEKLADYCGSRYGIGVSSGTDGLLLALMALGVGQGDEVLTTPFTFIATAEVIALLGARPLFADIDPLTYNLEPEGVAGALESLEKEGRRPKAIIAVSLYGQCPDLQGIMEIARPLGTPVIEDACQSFGATVKGSASCGVCDLSVTSFFPSKPLGCYGDGGMVFTDDTALADRVRSLRVHGQKRRYHHELLGINGRLDALQAAILLEKFRHFPKEVKMRQEAALRYATLLEPVSQQIRIPSVAEDRTSVHAQYTIEVPNREEVIEEMGRQGVPTAVHYPVPLHRQPVFSGLKTPSLTVAERAAGRVLSLPMHPYITEEEQKQVVDALAHALKE